MLLSSDLRSACEGWFGLGVDFTMLIAPLSGLNQITHQLLPRRVASYEWEYDHSGCDI